MPVATPATKVPVARLVGYVAPAADDALTAKQVMVLWEGASGSAGRVWWTGSYWAIRPWSSVQPAEHAALKRLVPRAKVSSLAYLGDSDLLALWRLAGQRPAGEPTEAQRAHLIRQGFRIPPQLPRLIATEALDLLAVSRDALDPKAQWLGPRPDAGRVMAALEAARGLGPSSAAEQWVTALVDLARAIFPAPHVSS